MFVLLGLCVEPSGTDTSPDFLEASTLLISGSGSESQCALRCSCSRTARSAFTGLYSSRMRRPVRRYLPASRQNLANLVRPPALNTHTHARTHMQCPLPERTTVPHNELSPGCAPLGVLCAGLSEDALEDLADAVESVFKSPDEVGSEPKASSWRRHSLLPQRVGHRASGLGCSPRFRRTRPRRPRWQHMALPSARAEVADSCRVANHPRRASRARRTSRSCPSRKATCA